MSNAMQERKTVIRHHENDDLSTMYFVNQTAKHNLPLLELVERILSFVEIIQNGAQSSQSSEFFVSKNL